jgi:hypothetical protein
MAASHSTTQSLSGPFLPVRANCNPRKGRTSRDGEWGGGVTFPSSLSSSSPYALAAIWAVL